MKKSIKRFVLSCLLAVFLVMFFSMATVLNSKQPDRHVSNDVSFAAADLRKSDSGVVPTTAPTFQEFGSGAVPIAAPTFQVSGSGVARIAADSFLARFFSGINTYAAEFAELADDSGEPDSEAILAVIPEFDGIPFVEVNGNKPFFKETDRTTMAYEYYPELDSLSRCGSCMACLGPELMPTEKRGEIGMVKPSGWNQAKYPELISDLYLWNRCHLIAFSFAGENANERNLITGTRYMNTQGMYSCEFDVAEYMKDTGHHVLYRATPLFHGDELVARGVLIEAESMEDDEVEFCVFCYNVQPGIGINYQNGESWMLLDTGGVNAGAPVGEKNLDTGALADGKSLDTGTPADTEGVEAVTRVVLLDQTHRDATYLVNINTGRFHWNGCKSGEKTAEKNRRYYNGSRDELIASGYVSAGCCHP